MSKRMLKEETKVLNQLCGISTIYVYFLFLSKKKKSIPPSPLNRNEKQDRGSGSGKLKFKEGRLEGNLHFTLSTFPVPFNYVLAMGRIIYSNKFKIKVVRGIALPSSSFFILCEDRKFLPDGPQSLSTSLDPTLPIR